jgi:hypothetical protein
MNAPITRARTWIVTQHAAERYIERHAPGLSFAASKERLLQQLVGAKPLRDRSRAGDPRWLISSLGVVAIVKEEPRGRTVVTVEPQRPEDVVEENEAVLVEAAAKLPDVTLHDLRRAPSAVREDLIARAHAPRPAPEPSPVVEAFISGQAAVIPPPAAPSSKPELDAAPVGAVRTIDPETLRRRTAARVAQPAPRPAVSLVPDAHAENLKREIQLATVRLAAVKEREKTERMRIHEASQNDRLKEALRVALVALDDATRALATVSEMLGPEHAAALIEVARKKAARAVE